MDRKIKRNAGLIVILIIGALITGCAGMGAEDGQDPLTPDGGDSGAQSETAQNPGTEPESGDTPEKITETDIKPVDEASASPPAAQTPSGSTSEVSPEVTTVTETPSGPAAVEVPDETSPEAIQSEPADPGLPPDQDVVSGPAISPEWELLASADVTRDGLEENIYLDKTEIDSGYVTLRVCDREDNVIWSEGAGTAHPGWNSIFLMEQGGEHYLLQYNPYMGQGYGSYTYILFILEGADENVIGGDLIDFDTSGTKELDVPRMVYFAETVNSLLSESILLVSSEGGEFAFGPSSAEPFFERYSWLDLWPELYEEGDDLETRLYKYSEFAMEQRNRYN